MTSQSGAAKPAARKRTAGSGNQIGWFLAGLIIGLLVLFVGVGLLTRVGEDLTKYTGLQYRYQDIAGRQRVIAQRMQTDLYTIGYQLSQHRPPDDAQLDLFQASTLFQSTLQVMQQGGKTQDSSGAVVSIPPLADARAKTIVQKTSDRWAPLQQSLAKVGASKTLSVASVAPAIQQGDEAIADLIDLSNELTSRIDASSNEQVNRFNQQRLFWGALAIFGFLVILASFFARLWRDKSRIEHTAEELSEKNNTLSEYSAQLAAAKQGTDAIMDTVRQGLFLVDKDFMIQGEYSKELESIFEQEHLEGRRLVDLLRPLLSEKMQDVTRRYLVLLFDQSKRDRAVMQANPLDPIDLSFPNPAGGYRTKSDSFNFRRLRTGDEITRVFVSATDITERVQLEQDMRETEQRKERQLELMFDLVQAEPQSLAELVQMMQRDLSEINSTLRAEDFADKTGVSQPTLRSRLDAIYRCVHNIKGNAGLVGIEAIAQSANAFETKLQEIKARRQTSGEDFLAAVVCQTELQTYLSDVVELREKLAGMHRAAMAERPTKPTKGGVPGAPATRMAGPLDSLCNLGEKIAAESGKQVTFDIERFDEMALPEKVRAAVKDTLIQLVRNSVVHGIEAPEARRQQGKPEAGTIEVWTERDRIAPGTVSLVYRDDGKGLDPEQILARAVERGLITKEQANDFQGEAAIGFIFEPGFSTAESTSMHAGRGVGMDIVRHQIVDEHNGEIALESQPGRYTKFIFTFASDLSPAVSLA